MRSVAYVVSCGICTGYGACDGICEHIKMQRNKMGFYSPVVDEKCDHCGKCMKECIVDPDREDD